MFGDDDVDFRYIMMNYDYTKNKTLPKITKYERALLIGKRAKQIEEGANPNIKVKDGQSAIEIAEEELRQRKIPLIIKRPNGNTFEYWKPADMEVMMD
jgi:DNA-directed RNA polymerase I, II, and III subunit RPABC2